MHYALLVGERPLVRLDNDSGPLRGLAMFQAVTRRPVTAEARPVHVGFAMDKVTLVRVSSKVLWLS